jgi:hypothetical protein
MVVGEVNIEEGYLLFVESEIRGDFDGFVPLAGLD